MISNLLINGTLWTVKRKKMKDMGECNFKTQTIYISTGMPKEQRETTLMHEVLHAILDSAGTRTNAKLTEEEFIELLDDHLVRFFQTNKNFLK